MMGMVVSHRHGRGGRCGHDHGRRVGRCHDHSYGRGRCRCGGYGRGCGNGDGDGDGDGDCRGHRRRPIAASFPMPNEIQHAIQLGPIGLEWTTYSWCTYVCVTYSEKYPKKEANPDTKPLFSTAKQGVLF